MIYPDLSNSDILALDLETYDPNLKTKGNGVYRKEGFILGVALSNGKGFNAFYGFDHKDIPFEERNKNKAYIKDQLSKCKQVVGAHILYDIDWLENFEGMKVNGFLRDVLIAEPLINELQYKFSLENVLKKYLNKSKNTSKPEKFCTDNKLIGDFRQHLHKMSFEAVSDYALGDTADLIEAHNKQLDIINYEGTKDIYDLECELLRVLLMMRKNGVRIDLNRLYKTGMQLQDKLLWYDNYFKKEVGKYINVNAAADMLYVFRKFNFPITYNTPTELMLSKGKIKGNPSFDKLALMRVDHPIVKAILNARHIKTLLSFYIEPYPDLICPDGRIHCNFHPLKCDAGGTITGRLSASQPNLQQVSGKDEEDQNDIDNDLKGQIIRKLFLPNEGCLWGKKDLSQIEYRMISHYGRGVSAEHIRERYRKEPKTDYHKEMMEMANLPDRKTTKALNFGAAYNMGWRKMAIAFMWEQEFAKEVYSRYHAKVPFIKYTSQLVADSAIAKRYIVTILGRRSRLKNDKLAYQMFNHLIQGSCADYMKKAMVDGYKAGIFDIIPLHLTVHDELDNSLPHTKEAYQAWKELDFIMNHTIPTMRVPVKSSSEIGFNWGELVEI